MKIARAFPPNYEQICKAFPVKDRPGVVFVYGDTLYAPGGNGTIPYHLRVHEETHVRQQAQIGPANWWKRYIADPLFRLAQEVEAYHNQFISMSRPDREREIRRIAGDLSSPMYGGLVTFKEAKTLIRTGRLNA